MKLTLILVSLSVVRWRIDASYNAHSHCKGHSGAMMNLARGAVIISSLKQKLSIKISTEGELVGSHDGMSMVLWSNHFIESQL